MQTSEGIVDSESREPLATDRPGYFIAGAGAPVVLLHSSLGSKSQWTALAERLSSRFRVIALDLCGYGDNAVPAAASTFTLDDEVRMVAARIDHLAGGRSRIHLVGHSYGGLVALRFAQTRRDRVASLSLYEPVVFRMLDDDDAELMQVHRLAAQVAAHVAAGRRNEAAQVFVDFWSGEGSYASLPPHIQVGISRRADKLPLDFRAAASWPLDPQDVRQIVAPTLLMVGNRSPVVVTRIHARLADVLPNRRIGAFDAGHLGPVTDAHRINPWFEAFLDRCATRGDAVASSLIAAAAPGTLARDRTKSTDSEEQDATQAMRKVF